MDKYVCVDADFINEMNIKEVNEMKEAHSHDYYEIYFFMGDEMTFFLDDTSINLHFSDLLLVNKHIFHKTHYIHPLKKINRANISFNAGFLYRYFDLESVDKLLKLFETPLLIVHDSRLREEISKLIMSVCDAFHDGKKYSILKGYYSLCMLLIEFLRNEELFKGLPSADGLPASDNRIYQIAKYININYSENITLDSIAKSFYISKFFLSHSFKETTGVSVTDFINRKRISEAANLLENTNLSLTEIANTVGFNNQPYFIKTFKNYNDVSPGKYRSIKGGLKEYCERISSEV